MGTFNYGPGPIRVEFDDRVLAHVHSVIALKVRRKEPFFFSWFDTQAVGDGRSAAWISPEVPMYFKYESSAPHRLNRQWLESMVIAAGSNQGLILTEEPTGEPIVATDNSEKP
jgi:hypothetical protein